MVGWRSVVFTLLFVVTFEVKVIRVELINLVENHFLKLRNRQVTTTLIIDRQVDLWRDKLFLLGKANVIEVGILEGLLGRGSLIRVEFKKSLEKRNSAGVCRGVLLWQVGLRSSVKLSNIIYRLLRFEEIFDSLICRGCTNHLKDDV